MKTTFRQKIAKVLFKAAYSELNDYWYTPFTTPSKTGVEVSESTALTFSAVWACNRVISETVASLPLHVYRRLEGGGKKKAMDHSNYDILHTQPNPEMTSMQYREAAQSHLNLWGNHYSFIDRRRARGEIIGLWPLDPSRMTVERDDRTDGLIYKYLETESGKPKLYSPDEIFHIAGLGFNGLIGYSPIAKAREAIGVGLALEEFGARFFGNGVTLSGILEHPSRLQGPAYEHLRQSVKNKHGGLKNAFEPMILEEGMKWHDVTIPLDDAQFLESKKFQVLEICRIFNVPPYKVMDYDRATFSNVEQTAIDWVVHGIRPWLVRWEQAMATKLFSKEENREFFAEHLVDGLLRGDIQSRYNAYQIARQNGVLNADEWRELENMNPQPEEKGKIYYINAAMVPIGRLSNGGSIQPTKKTSDEIEEDDMSIEDKEELDRLRKTHLMNEKQIKELNEKVITQEAEIKAFPEQIEANRNKDRAEIEKLNQKISERDNLIQKLSSEKDSQIISLNATVVDCNNQINLLSSQIKQMKQSYSGLFTDAIQRILRREQIGIKRAIQKKDLSGFETQIDEFYKELPEFMSATLHPCVTTYAQFNNSTEGINFISDFIPNHINESKTELKKWVGIYIHDDNNGGMKRNDQAIEDCLNLWIKQRPEKAINQFQTFFVSS